MHKEIHFYQEMASELQLQENGKGQVPLETRLSRQRKKCNVT